MKRYKLVSFVLAIAMIISVCPLNIFATGSSISGVEIKGIYETLETIAGTYTYNGDAKNLTFEWFASSEKNGEYAKIGGETTANLVVNSSLADKWVKFRVNLNTEKYDSEPVKIGSVWVGKPHILNDDSGRLLVVNNTTPSEYKFTIEGQEFMLLDTTNSDESHFLVMSKKTVENMNYNPNHGQDFDYMANWLNTTYTVSGNAKGEKLPKVILDNINMKNKWKIEPKTNNNEESIYEAGIAVPAVTEIQKYCGKMGLYDEANIPWWTRTPAKINGTGDSIMATSDFVGNVGKIFSQPSFGVDCGVRPIFYLNKDFFLDAKLDLATVGTDVRGAITKTYTRAQLLAAGYAEDKLAAFYDSKGDITNLNAKGLYETSLKMDVSYEYSGTPADITYRWLISDKEDGYYTQISNARDYTVGMETGGNFIKFAAVKPNGDYTTTAPRKIHKNWNTGIGEMPDGEGHVIPYKNEFTPKEFVFGIDGQDFILLESTESDESRFLVMSKASIGKRNINKGGQLLGDLLAWLNNKNSINRTYHGSTSTDATDDYTTTGYIGNAGFTQLPQKILDNINKTNKWKQEIKMWEADSEMVYEAGLAIPSVTELIRHSEKIGLCDTGANWWTRTPFAKSKASGELMMRVLGTKAEMGNVKNAMGNTDNLDIRPMFYLKKDFFTKVKVNLADVGVGVRKEIRKNYTRAELLAAGYTEDELSKYYDAGGGVTNFELNGTCETSLPMNISYTYTGTENELVKRWLIADTEKGAYIPMTNSANANSIIIPTTAGGKWIKGAMLMPNGEEIDTLPKQIKAPWERQGVIDANSEEQLKYKLRTTPKENIFTLGGQEFIMLDSQMDDKSKFLVMSNKMVAKRAFNEAGEGQLFTDMISWLNNKNGVSVATENTIKTDTTRDYTLNGYIGSTAAGVVQMPKGILDHVNKESYWKTEIKMWEDTVERSYQGGFALPAVHDIKMYGDKIGLAEEPVGFFTRTPNGVRGGDGNSILGTSDDANNAGFFFPLSKNDVKAIRPIFYLDKAFFTSVKIEGAGSAVAKIVRDNYTRAELLAAGYTEDELLNIFDYGKINTVFTNVKAGGTVTANVSITDLQSQEITLAFAIYDDNNSLIGITYSNFTTENTINEQKQTLTIDNVKAGNNTAKVMIFKGKLENLEPLTKANNFEG
ncbi:MAG: hypothetical protein RSB38_05340, partial [Oscillospiraceae bacterium]